ncbi:MAG: ankyrin repeat domain-containing protein [Dysgonamonadaceae bacterium]|jgi:hypothetical protein|nr:ankyrin repeat domain-containing protein [Dysgonamonadaceae bacterium]
MKTTLTLVAIVLAILFAKPLFDTFMTMPIRGTNHSSLGPGFTLTIDSLFYTILTLIGVLTLLIVSAHKISDTRILVAVWTVTILLGATYPIILTVKNKNNPEYQFEKNWKTLREKAENKRVSDAEIRRLAQKVAKTESGIAFEILVKNFRLDIAHEMIENGEYKICENASILLVDMVRYDYDDKEFKRATFLIENKTDVNRIVSHNGRTPIFYALEKGNIQSVKLLLENGANVNIRDNDGITPLSIAILQDDQYITLLLEYGVTPEGNEIQKIKSK